MTVKEMGLAVSKAASLLVCEMAVCMAWELDEQESLTIARLMVASPEFVYEQIKFYGENVNGFWGKKEELETALLERDDKLINLALAQFAASKKIVQAIYDRATSDVLESDSNRFHEANPLISNHLHAPCTRLSYGETA